MSVTDLTLSIMELNDDCLLHIFKFIAISGRVTLELVCKRWQELTCSLWKITFLFDVKDENQLKYENTTPKKIDQCPTNDIRVSLCKQIFERCSQFLTKINLSRIDFQNMTLMSYCDYCSLEYLYMGPGTLDDLLPQLLSCVHIQELCLCRCVIEMSDASLTQLFCINKKLHSLTLCGYDFSGKCFTDLNLETIEVLNLTRCHMKPSNFNSIISIAHRVHTLTLQSCKINDLEDIHTPFRVSAQKPLTLVRLNVSSPYVSSSLVRDIYEMANLTILNINEHRLTDVDVKLLVQNCTKLLVLCINRNHCLTDRSLCSVRALAKLECLDIGGNYNFTDVGLKLMNNDLKILSVACTRFSAKAILAAIEKMQFLVQLDVSGCVHLGNSFVHAVFNLVKRRENKLPLELGTFDSAIHMSKIKNPCSLVRLTDNRFKIDYKRFY